VCEHWVSARGRKFRRNESLVPFRVPSIRTPPETSPDGVLLCSKRPDPPRPRDGSGLARTCHDAHGGRGRVMTKREATLNERTRRYSRQTQRSAVPLRSPSFGAVQCLDVSRAKQAHWWARPPILRNTQSRSKRRQRQTEWSCASEFSHPNQLGCNKRSDDEWYAGPW
jgi:hypothetical protein